MDIPFFLSPEMLLSTASVYAVPIPSSFLNVSSGLDIVLEL